MRKVALLVTAVAVACFGVVGVSSAINGKAGLKMKVTPSKKGTKAKPANIKLFTDVITTPAADDQPFATKTTVVHFDKNLVFNGSKLKQCPQATVQADQTKCPSGSKVGTGKATGNALGQTENLTVTAYNGPGGNKIELHVVGSAPLVIDSVIEGVLKSDTGKFGKKLVVKIPENLQQPLTGVFATLTDFQVTVKATSASKVPFIGLKGCPSNKKLNFKSDLTYTDGTKKSATTTTNCSK
jgi:hypothetical protein